MPHCSSILFYPSGHCGWRRIYREGAGKTLLHDEQIYHRTAYQIFGFIDDDTHKLQKEYDGVKVLSGSDKLVRYVNRLHLDEVIPAIPEHEILFPEMQMALIRLEEQGTRVRFAYDIYEQLTGRVMVKFKNGQYFLANPYSINQKKSFYRVANRMLNIVWGCWPACLLFCSYRWCGPSICSAAEALCFTVRKG